MSSPALIEQDLRPLSLTYTLAKVMEGFTCSRLLPQLEGKIDPCQFSRKGHSTTDALIYMLQAIYEAVDSGEASARIFFADFSKGFDLIDHSILMQELADLEVHPVLLSWIAAFLTSRKQAVRIGRTLSDWLTLKGGVPQGTKLGVILFTVMTNKLLSDWRLRIKYVLDQAKRKAIEMYFQKFCRKSKARNFDLDFYSSISVELVAPKMVNFAQKRNETYMFGTPFPTLLSLPPASIKADGRTPRS